jgi:two-component sensor histidine kinase
MECQGGTMDRPTVWMEEAMHRAANLRHLAANIGRLHKRDNWTPDDQPRAARRAAELLDAYEALDVADDATRSCAPDLANIVGGLVETFGYAVGSVVLLLEVQPVELAADRRRALLLAASELVINALRHAFPGRRSGMLKVSLQYDPQEGEATMRVADNGVGPNGIATARGMGCSIIRGLAEVLDGSIVWRRSASFGGTEAVLSFPLV